MNVLGVHSMRIFLSSLLTLGLLTSTLSAHAEEVDLNTLISEGIVVSTQVVDLNCTIKSSKSKFGDCKVLVTATAENGVTPTGEVPVTLCASPFWIKNNYKDRCYKERKGVWTKTVSVPLNEVFKFKVPNRLRTNAFMEVSTEVVSSELLGYSGQYLQRTFVKPLTVKIKHPSSVAWGERVKVSVSTSPKFNGTCSVWQQNGSAWNKKTGTVKIKNGKGTTTVRWMWDRFSQIEVYLQVRCTTRTVDGMGEVSAWGYKP
jgi:hypothetical protein